MTTQRYFSLGRFAMRDALRYAGVKPGDCVMLPSFICRDVLAAVATLGATHDFYDVDKSLKPKNLTGVDTHKSIKAIVAVNYFGFAQDLDVFRDFARRTGATIIEDNAHGLLSRDETNQPLGQREKFGITSFRKTLNVDNGAILTTSMREEEIEAQLAYDESSISSRSKMLRWLSKFESFTKIPVVNIAQSLSRLTRYISSGSQLPQRDALAETIIPGLPNPNRQSVSVLQNLNESVEIARRRDLYLKLQPQVVAVGATLIFNELPINTCPYGLPIFANHNLKRKLAKIARKNRVTLMTWPDLPDSILSGAPEFYSQVWLFNFK